MTDEERYPWLTPEMKRVAMVYSAAVGGGYYELLDAFDRIVGDSIVASVDFEQLAAEIKALDNEPWYVKAWWKLQDIVRYPYWLVMDWFGRNRD